MVLSQQQQQQIAKNCSVLFACVLCLKVLKQRHATIFKMNNHLLRLSTIFKISNQRCPTLIARHRFVPIMVCQVQRFRHLGHNRIRKLEMEKFTPLSNAFENAMSFKNFCTQNVPKKKDQTENILTVPNVLTVGRMVMCPFLGYLVIQNDYSMAFNLFVVAGITDLVCLFDSHFDHILM